MKYLNFEKNVTTRWRECKAQYQERFWDNLHHNILQDVKAVIESQINEEFEEQIGAKRYERTNSRKSARLGKRYRTLETEYGFIENITIPRARDFGARFSIFDKWQRIQKKVLQAMLQAYLLARSAKDAGTIVKSFGNSKYSRSFYQRLAKRLEESMIAWLERPITKTYPYVFIDGMGTKVFEGYLKDKVVMWALGMDENCHTDMLGFIVADTESEEAVRSLVIDLRKRGLQTPKLFISDQGGGIEAALMLEYPHVPHQWCAFHKMKNIPENLSNMKNRKEILADAAHIYATATSKKSAYALLRVFCNKWERRERNAVRLFAKNFDRTIIYFQYPQAHRKSIYTSNPVESFISRIRAWTNKFTYFDSKANLNLALFTYFYSKHGDTVLSMNSDQKEKTTLFVA
jgi:transposase-like protein